MNTKDNDGRTALMLALEKGHADIAKYPRSKGAK
jgi:ankyrin repeat protein